MMKLKKYQFKKGPKKTNSDKKMTKIDKKKNVTGHLANLEIQHENQGEEREEREEKKEKVIGSLPPPTR